MHRKRHVKRVHLIYYLLVFEGGSDTLLGHVVDVSSEGLKLMSKGAIEAGRMLDIRMVLPGRDGDGSRQVEFKARCVWCRKNVYSDFYGAGFHIEDIDGADVALLRDLINEFGY